MHTTDSQLMEENCFHWLATKVRNT